MRNKFCYLLMLAFLQVSLVACATAPSDASGPKVLKPVAGEIRIPLASINDGQAHHFMVQADDGTTVIFFVIKSKDGVLRAAIDACDVCYKAGKGYHQDGDSMVCENCGQMFDTNRINVVKGGCNPAPLNRTVDGDQVVIAMQDINANTWYMEYRQK